jgi:hypothetical protein
MRRTITAGLLLLILAGVAGQARQADAQAQQRKSGTNAEWRQAECRFGGIDEGGWTYREVRLSIECSVAKWTVYGGLPKAMSVAECESGLNAYASNGGRYLGVYQHAAAAWPSRQNSLNPDAWDKPIAESAFNGRANVVVAIRMAHSSGWGAWSCT